MDPLSFLGLVAWMAVMTCAVLYISLDTVKTARRRKTPINEPPFVKAMRLVLGMAAEERIRCQTPCRASRKEILDELKLLIEFHRPCLQYPLSEHWWKLVDCDYNNGELSAELHYQDRRKLPIGVKLVWDLRKTVSGEIEVSLEWFRLNAIESQDKHNILLSMAAYTEEHLKKLNDGSAKSLIGRTSAAAVAAIPTTQKYVPQIDPPESVSWPTAQDFNEAVQNPRICFLDEELRECEAELNMLGVPRAISGNFATVYRIFNETHNFAVRCFINPVRDQHLRYSILSKHLANDSTSAIVNFSFVQEGIKVLGKAYPILKMEWADGQAFTSYIEQNLESKETIANLRAEFRKMVCDLRKAKIAHGDLQHGNILVKDDGKLVLVDYDGMFVPELVRFHSAELGHPNYQHPRRAGKHFGLFLDNFAGWLIDTSLICLEEDPMLWKQFDGGDECILFRRKDLQKPDESRIFRALARYSSGRIFDAVQHFRSLLKMELEEVPFLELEEP